MTIEDLKNVKLSPMTAGYLAIYIKLSDLCGEAAKVTEMDYGGSAVDEVNKEFDSALDKAQDEVMKLAVMSMTENLPIYIAGRFLTASKPSRTWMFSAE